MAYSTIVRVDVIRSLSFEDISATYSLFEIGSGDTETVDTGFAHRMRIVDISNATDGDMFIAFTSSNLAPASDGTADNLFIPAGGFTLFDLATNSETSGSPLVFQVGTCIWVRYSTAPTKKAVYVECVYAKSE